VNLIIRESSEVGQFVRLPSGGHIASTRANVRLVTVIISSYALVAGLTAFEVRVAGGPNVAACLWLAIGTQLLWLIRRYARFGVLAVAPCSPRPGRPDRLSASVAGGLGKVAVIIPSMRARPVRTPGATVTAAIAYRRLGNSSQPDLMCLSEAHPEGRNRIQERGGEKATVLGLSRLSECVSGGLLRNRAQLPTAASVRRTIPGVAK
jgi:hypothetical protein